MATINDVSIRQLQYLVAVADELGFHRAAERCHASQPTVSAQIAQLEQVLGVQVFERDQRRVLVTPAGEAIVAEARKVLVAVGDLLASAERATDPMTGTLRIGVIPTVAPYLLADVLPPTHAKYPRLELRFREERTEAVVTDLREGKLDAGLLALEAEIGGDWAVAKIARDPFVVAMPKGHPLARKARVAAAQLEGSTVLLLDDGHCFREQALAVCARSGAEENEVRATSLATLVQMVSMGAGITLLPELAVPVENRRGQLEVRPFAAPAPFRTLALIWRTSSPMGTALRAVATAFREALERKGRSER